MINYEMALTEIEMYKKAHESLSENLTHANKKIQQLKVERNSLIDNLSWYKEKVSRLEDEISQSDYVKASVLGDREEYKNKIIELIEENKTLRTDKYTWIERYKQTVDEKNQAKDKTKGLERENEKLRNESIKNYKLWEESEEQERYFVKEFNKYHNLYTTLTDHIRDMRSDMLKTYENYEVQKHINKDEGIYKILEGAQISLAVVLDELSKIDELERADDER